MNSNFETKLCKLLIELKSQYPYNYNKIISMLEFIFKDIKVDYLDKEIDLLLIDGKLQKVDGWRDPINDANRLNKLSNEYFQKLVVEDGIIDILLELGMEKDSRFIKKFFEAVEVPIDLLKRKVVLDTRPHFYLTNIYAMLCAYRANKDNYENYEALVDDIALTFIKTEKNQRIDVYSIIRNFESYSIIDNFEVKKYIISKMVAIEDYHKLNEMRNYFCSMLHGLRLFDSDKEKQRLDEMFSMYQEFYSDVIKLTRLGYNIKEKLKYEISDDISLLVHNDLLPGVYPYYSGLLLLENRYKYFKEKIRVINPYYRKEIFEFIKKLTPGIFENKIGEKDSFEVYMDIIFDSDTYKELMNKLNVLKEAHNKYVGGNKDISHLLDELNDKRHKDSFGKIIISYETSSNNKIDKPNTIDKRMKNLYKKYDLVGEEFDFDKQRENLSTLINILDEEVLQHDIRKNPLSFQPRETQPVKKKSKFSIFG